MILWQQVWSSISSRPIVNTTSKTYPLIYREYASKRTNKSTKRVLKRNPPSISKIVEKKINIKSKTKVKSEKEKSALIDKLEKSTQKNSKPLKGNLAKELTDSNMKSSEIDLKTTLSNVESSPSNKKSKVTSKNAKKATSKKASKIESSPIKKLKNAKNEKIMSFVELLQSLSPSEKEIKTSEITDVDDYSQYSIPELLDEVLDLTYRQQESVERIDLLSNTNRTLEINQEQLLKNIEILKEEKQQFEIGRKTQRDLYDRELILRENQIEEHKQQIDQLQNQIVAIRDAYEDGEDANVKPSYTLLKEENVELQSKLRNLEAHIKNLEDHIQNLEHHVTSQSSKYPFLEDQASKKFDQEVKQGSSNVIFEGQVVDTPPIPVENANVNVPAPIYPPSPTVKELGSQLISTVVKNSKEWLRSFSK